MTNCPQCSTENTADKPDSRGYFRCKECGKNYKADTENVTASVNTVDRNVQGGTVTYTGRVPKQMTDDELAEYFNIDTSKYRIVRVVYSEREVYRKDKKVEWEVQDGVVISGSVDDSGKILVEPLYSVKVFTELKAVEIANDQSVQELIEKAKDYAPKYKSIKYKKHPNGVLYEVEMPDLQLGRMVMASEAGEELTPDIAVEIARSSIEQLLSYASLFPVERVVFPVGHDFFNSNTSANTTARGTPQRDDPRWQRTYRLGKDLLIELIETMSQIAPVDVPVIVGNHDEERMFYLGDTLESWFNRNPNVSVDNSDSKRKYRPFGKCLLGLTHGYWEPLKNLPQIMAVERPELWATSQFREWHVGDKHHQDITITQPSKEYPGTVVRIIRSLATPSVWEYDKGFVGTRKATESFVWDKDKGIIAQFTA